MKINLLEIKRKTWHILWGVVFFFLIKYTDKIIYQSALIALLILGVSILILRSKKFRIGWVEYLLKTIGREGEGIEAAFYFGLSIFLSSLFFEQKIVALSALALGVCDGLATIIGVHFGKNRLYKKKTLEGSSAFLASCFLIIYLSGYAKITALVCSIIMAGVELFADINDNLIIPPVFSLILKIFG